jgi:hypothetical protein
LILNRSLKAEEGLIFSRFFVLGTGAAFHIRYAATY